MNEAVSPGGTPALHHHVEDAGRGGRGSNLSSLARFSLSQAIFPLASRSLDWMLNRHSLSLSPWYSGSPNQRAKSRRHPPPCREHLPRPAGGCRLALDSLDNQLCGPRAGALFMGTWCGWQLRRQEESRQKGCLLSCELTLSTGSHSCRK